MSKSQGLRLRLRQPDIARWRARVVATSTCHIWMGAVGSDGYGRFSLRGESGGEQMVTPHQIAARLAFGPLPVGSTLMHDCDVRICVSTAAGHVRIATQRENMRQAARRGRAVGPRPGLVDVRGKVGASRAVQEAVSDAAQGGASPEQLAVVLAQVLAAGDPLRGLVALFDSPRARVVAASVGFPVDLFDAAAQSAQVPSSRRIDSLPLFDFD